ncbi:MAG: hypothetical protein L0Y74_10955 [candidate division Zixibacteria bacterium]|nr:hypothetical protein [candidate division Zixibacteria bacterium]
MITEFGVSYRLYDNSKVQSFDKFPVDGGYSSWEVGLMKNVAERHAVGLGLFTGIEWRSGGAGLGWGVKPRYRYWINRDLALDLSPGLLLDATEGSFNPPGFTGSVSLGIKELLILTSSVEVNRFVGYNYSNSSQPVEEERVSLYLGAKAGSGLGAITGSVAAVAVVVGVMIALSSLTVL